MAKLTTKANFSLAQMMVQNLDPRKSIIDEIKEEILRLLPRGTVMIGLQEIVSYSPTVRQFELTFDCPFFKNDFEFMVEFTRSILTDGENIHQYQQATKIINMNEQKAVSNG